MTTLAQLKDEIVAMAKEQVTLAGLNWEEVIDRKLKIGSVETWEQIVVTIHNEIHPNLDLSYTLQGKLASWIENRFENVKVFEFGDWFQLMVCV